MDGMRRAQTSYDLVLGRSRLGVLSCISSMLMVVTGVFDCILFFPGPGGQGVWLYKAARSEGGWMY